MPRSVRLFRQRNLLGRLRGRQTADLLPSIDGKCSLFRYEHPMNSLTPKLANRWPERTAFWMSIQTAPQIRRCHVADLIAAIVRERIVDG